MAKSDKKYADPTGVLRSLTNDDGQPIEIGPERDIGEFNDTLLSRVQEGLNYKQIYQNLVKIKAEKDQAANKAAEAPILVQEDVQMEGVEPQLIHQDSSILEE